MSSIGIPALESKDTKTVPELSRCPGIRVEAGGRDGAAERSAHVGCVERFAGRSVEDQGVAVTGSRCIAERLITLRDPSPDEVPLTPSRRHVWVDGSGGYTYPGLVMAWRRAGTGWEAQVAVVRLGSFLVQSTAAAALHPLTDDGWDPLSST